MTSTHYWWNLWIPRITSSSTSIWARLLLLLLLLWSIITFYTSYAPYVRLSQHVLSQSAPNHCRFCQRLLNVAICLTYTTKLDATVSTEYRAIKHSDFCCFKGVTYVALTLCFKLISFFTLILVYDLEVTVWPKLTTVIISLLMKPDHRIPASGALNPSVLN